MHRLAETAEQGTPCTDFDEVCDLNSTCPQELIRGLQDNFFSRFQGMDQSHSRGLNSTMNFSFGPRDPRSLEDEEREAQLLRSRKDGSLKTALCDPYRRTGFCKDGGYCRFAHGVNELQPPSQPRGRAHPKYKTTLCENFSTTGYCKYGPRCLFIHKFTNYELLKQPNQLRTRMAIEDDPLILYFLDRSHNLDLNSSMPLTPTRENMDSSLVTKEAANPIGVGRPSSSRNPRLPRKYFGPLWFIRFSFKFYV